MASLSKRPCSIEHVGKQRNGKPRFWCLTHQASATGKYGVKLDECESAYRDYQCSDVFEFEPDKYPGGLALWGAVSPVFNTATVPIEAGIHVHARTNPGGTKVIDRTYEAVRTRFRRTLFNEIDALVTRETAVSYYISRYLNREIEPLFCMYCGEVHLDADYFAVKPHRQHLCHACGRHFRDNRRRVSNPIALLSSASTLSHKLIRSDKTVMISQDDFPGGMQIWASNPAFAWTANRPEEEGLHLHTFNANGHYIHDDTYGSIVLDGETLNEEHIKHFMAQASLKYLSNKIVCLRCPECNEPHFDAGDLGFLPHIEHICESCGMTFSPPGRNRRCVSNPFVETRERLMASRRQT